MNLTVPKSNLERVIRAFAFPDDCTPNNFEKAAAVARICLGAILTHRHIDLIFASPLSDPNGIDSLIALAGSIFILLGLFTPLSLPITVLIDTFIVWNLGSRLVFLTGLIVWLGNGWKYYSLDRLLISTLPRRLHFLYSLSNEITYPPQTIRTLGLLIWGGMTLTSASFHATDEAWVKGFAVIHLLRTPYYNDFYELFYSIDTQLLLILSKISCYLMMIWQAFLWALPGIKATRRFSFAMGVLFFSSSILFINLSYLPYTELIFWLLIYCPNMLSVGADSKYIHGGNPAEQTTSRTSMRPAVEAIKRFIKYNIIISFVVFNTGNTVRLFAGDTSELRALIDSVLLNKYYRKWNLVWGQAPLDDFNSNTLYNYRFSIVGCREYIDSTSALIPWEDGNGGRLKYLKNDRFFLGVSEPFKQSTSTKSWDIDTDKILILREFKALSAEIASFDLAISNTIYHKISGYTFYLVENFVRVDNSLPIGWSTGNESRIVSEFTIPRPKKQSASQFKHVVPPGHLFEAKRMEQTAQRYCK